MPAVSPTQLVNAIREAISESGFFGSLLSPPRQHPRKFFITSPQGMSETFWIYIWTLTHGGRPSLPDEYRIQMTTVQSPLELNPSGRTLLMGYDADLGMFAGFDLESHRSFTTGSPSVQIDINAVKAAQQDGLAFDRKTNDEIAIGIRPDHLVDYAMNSTELHELGAFPDTFPLLSSAVKLEDIADTKLVSLPEPRKRIVRKVSQLARDANFRIQVMQAYGHRCAMTRAQLRLVEAAHILPVGAKGSDEVRNGIALSPTCHKAYDQSLVYLDTDYEMKLNRSRVEDLKLHNLAGGLSQIKSHLGKILLPQDKQQWPDPQMIRDANELRQISR